MIPIDICPSVIRMCILNAVFTFYPIRYLVLKGVIKQPLQIKTPVLQFPL